MPLKVAVQIDDEINFKVDSTIYLSKEAQYRGYKIFYYNTHSLIYNSGAVYANGYNVEILSDKIAYKENITINLNEVDFVLMRQNPPFNMRYITSTYILEKCKSLVINNPVSVRNSPEKILHYNEFILPTLITENINIIKEFCLEHKQIVLKPLYSFGGNDVVHIISPENAQAVAKIMISLYNEPVMAQKFLPEVLNSGDKRVVLLNGKILGFYKRTIIKKGEFRAGAALGSVPTKTSLSSREMDICTLVGSDLASKGILLAGIDILGEYYLGEINVTSPTGLTSIEGIFQKNVASDCWDCFESKLI